MEEKQERGLLEANKHNLKEVKDVLVKIENIEDGSTSVFDGKSENCAKNGKSDKVKVTNDVNSSNVRSTEDCEGAKVKHEDEDDRISDLKKENKTDDLGTKDSKETDKEDAEVTEINEGEEMPITSEFIEFEFSPIKKDTSGQKDRSASPDEVAVLDQLYEAAQREDRDELCNLMFSKGDGENEQQSSAIKELKKAGLDENTAIINLLKRKQNIEKGENVANFETKKPRIEPENVVDFTNVKNVRSLGSLPLGNLTCFVPVEKPVIKKKRNPYRTPTPPNLNPSGDPIYESRFVLPKTIKPEKSLIDYSVLTKALSKTLESKINEGENNDVKIVIFCNNKPIQSFSVRNNNKKSENKTDTEKKADSNSAKTDKSNLPPSMLPPASSILSAQKPAKELDSVVNVNDILAQKRAFLTKQLNQNIELSKNNIPKIIDMKAVLERNKKLADESLSKLAPTRPKTKRLSEEHIDILLKEFQERNKGGELSTLSEPDQQNSKDSEKDEDLEESNLVINDSITTDENCNEGSTHVKCDQCQKIFKHQRYLNRHKIRVHSTSKQVIQSKVQIDLEQDKPEEDNINKALAVLIAKSNETSLEKMKKDTNKSTAISNADGEKPDGTAEELESSFEIKAEPVSEVEDQEIQSVLADDNVMNLLETADKSKRSLYNQENQPELVAKQILNGTYRPKGNPHNGMPLVTEQGLTEPVYVCEQCGKFYRARKTLKDHFLREHAKYKDDEPLYLYITGNKYQCPICFNNYHSGSELVNHTKKHTGELRSVCKLCGKVYASVHVLRRHIENIHSDVKPRPFQCVLCTYAASNKWHLKEHYRRHTGEQPFKCPVCDKSFSHQGTMNRHCKTIHKMEVPSQRPFVRNNIADLPDLPYKAPMTEEEFPMPEGFPTNEDIRLMCGGNDTSSDPGNDVDLDLSIVKTEPMDVEVE